MESSSQPIDEKGKLFDLLESFFAVDDNEYIHNSLFDSYELAKDTGSEYFYQELLRAVNVSKYKVPGFSAVKILPKGENGSNALEVHFEEPHERIHTTNATTSRLVRTREEHKSNNSNFPGSYTQDLNEIRCQVAACESFVHVNNNHLDAKYHSLELSQKEDISEMRALINRLQANVFRDKDDFDDDDDDDDDDDEEDRMVEDSFAFIMISPYSLPGFCGFFVFFSQLGAFLMSVWDIFVEDPKDSGYAKSPPLSGMPLANPIVVLVGQYFALTLSFLLEDALSESLLQCYTGFDDTLRNQGISFSWWLISNLLRFFEGTVSIVVIFVVIVSSSDVVSLFKDFTAMTFISSLDNIFFSLASMGILGKTLKQATKACSGLKYRNVHLAKSALKRTFTSPLLVILTLHVLSSIFWVFYFLVPQVNGQFLCQKIKFQFDDAVNPHLSYYSGEFVLNHQRGIMEPEITYIENKTSFSSNSTAKQAKIQYCRETNCWVLSTNETNPCKTSEVLAETCDLSTSERFDILEVSADSWLVNSVLSFGNNKEVPLEHLYKKCLDKDPEPPQIPQCDKIINDDLRNEFADSVIKWSRNFTLYPNNTSIYKKPVYWNKREQGVIFLGKRWAMVEMNFNDEKSVTNFHGRWSNYNVSFLSEPIIPNTPKDTASPTDLKWIEARKIERNDKTYHPPNLDKKVKGKYICHYCNDKYHPCRNHGTCNNHTKQCECSYGATGRLCQRSPTNDGKCDNDLFNVPSEAYDGGDCCAKTCRSSTYTCGRDKSKKFYVGYGNCKKSRINTATGSTDFREEVCPLLKTFNFSEELSILLIAVVNKNNEVVVYDLDGSKWRQRPVVKKFPDGNVKLDISEPEGIATNFEDFYSPATVATVYGKRVNVYQWLNGKWKTNSIEGLSKLNVTNVYLRDHGNLLGLLLSNNTIVTYRRKFFSKPWKNEKSYTLETILPDLVSMSNDGTLTLGNKTHLRVHQDDHVFFKSYRNNICLVSISNDGKIIAFLAFNNNEYYITLVNRFLNSTKSIIRNVPEPINAEMFVRNDDDVFYYTDQKIHHYMQNEEKKWVSTSTAMNDCDEIYNLIMTYIDTSKECEDIVHFTFLFTNQRGISFEVLNITESKNDILLKGGPYPTLESVNIQNDVCNETNTNLAIKIRNVNLRGLRNESLIGVAKNGNVIWNSIGKSTSSYETIFYIEDPNNNTLMSKRHDEDFYLKCYASRGCALTLVGNFTVRVGKYDKLDIKRQYGFSADGKVVVYQYLIENNVNNDIQIHQFNYNNRNWHNVKNLTSKYENHSFMYIISVSANGLVTALGAAKDRHGKDFGHVRLFRNEIRNITNIWNESVISGTNIGGGYDGYYGIGFTLSVSADGSTIAIGLNRFDALSKPCHAFVYHYENKKWNMKGPCLNVTSIKEYNDVTNVVISSDGLVVAVALYHYHANGKIFAGLIQAFEYNSFDLKWIEKGQSIRGKNAYAYLGLSFDLSGDGSILACGSVPSEHVYIYEFSHSENMWIQRKNAAHYFGKSAEDIRHISLSSSGNVLFTSYDREMVVLIYLEDLREYVDLYAPTNILEDEVTVAREIGANITDHYVSPDCRQLGLLMSTEDHDSLEIYDFVFKPEAGESQYKLTIKVDQFPNDIEWYLLNSKGKKLYGSVMPDVPNDVRQTLIDLETNDYHTFFISDSFGDGLCCDWGNGYFKLVQNHESLETKVFIDDKDFKKYKQLCIPGSDSSKLIKNVVKIVNDPYLINAKERWVLNKRDRDKKTYHTLLSDSFTHVNEDLGICTKTTDCLIFSSANKNGTGFEFELAFGEEEIKKRKSGYFLETVYSKQCETLTCSKDEKILTLQLYTDAYYRTENKWYLFNSSLHVIASETKPPDDKIFKNNNINILEKCIPKDECVIFRLTDDYSDGGTIFSLQVGSEKHVGVQTDEENFVSTDSCKKKCASNSVSFEILFENNATKPFLWNLTDDSNKVLDEGRNYTKTMLYYEKECIPKFDGDVTLTISDSSHIKLFRLGYYSFPDEHKIKFSDTNKQKISNEEIFK